MSGLYLPGVEMPNKKNGAVLIIYPDGKCAFEDGKTYQAIPVSDHGRMIDADKALADNEEYYSQLGRPDGVVGASYRSVLRSIILAPTIIPADKEG